MMSLLRFWTLIMLGSLLSMGGSESSQIPSKYLNLCSEDELRSYMFETIWGWVINDRIFIFGWTIALTSDTTTVSLYHQTWCKCKEKSMRNPHSTNTCLVLLLLLLLFVHILEILFEIWYFHLTFIDEISQNLHSNTEEHLDRMVRRWHWAMGPDNFSFWLYCQKFQVKHALKLHSHTYCVHLMHYSNVLGQTGAVYCQNSLVDASKPLNNYSIANQSSCPLISLPLSLPLSKQLAIV